MSGRIVEIGKEVKGWSVGDRVLYHGDMFRPRGGFAAYAIQDSQTLIPHPELSPEVAAATPCAGWAAWRPLNDKLRVREHNSILIGGGVGGFAIQIAHYIDLQQIIVTCSAHNRDYVKELGATHVINYRTEDVVSRLLEITAQQGVAVGLDAVGPDNDVIVANSLAYEGHMVELVDTVRPSSCKDAFMIGLSVHQLSLGAAHRNGPTAESALTSAGRTFSTLVEHCHVKAPIIKIISLMKLVSP